jgi:hypothetical protein
MQLWTGLQFLQPTCSKSAICRYAVRFQALCSSVALSNVINSLDIVCFSDTQSAALCSCYHTTQVAIDNIFLVPSRLKLSYV